MDFFSKPSVFSANDMCMPAKVYFVLAMLSVVFSGMMSFQVSTVIFSIIVLILWTLLLNWICILGFKGISWALVVLPFIGILFTVVVANESINQNNRNNPNNLVGPAVSSMYDSIQKMEGQLNNFLGTPGPTYPMTTGPMTTGPMTTGPMTTRPITPMSS